MNANQVRTVSDLLDREECGDWGEFRTIVVECESSGEGEWVTSWAYSDIQRYSQISTNKKKPSTEVLKPLNIYIS